MNEISSVDQFVRDTPAYPGSTDKIIRDELISVVGATLSIEGTSLNRDDIEQSFEKADVNAVLQRKEQEAENSRKVYRFIIDTVLNNEGDTFVYSESLIKQIHAYFTENMNYISNVPGAYRTNYIATFGEPRKDSLCRTQLEIQTAMSNFINWLNNPREGFLIRYPHVKAIMAHYYLSEIHPFGDGNGRTARALEALILYASGVNKYCFWSLANFWSEHKEEYLTRLHNVRVTCDPWEFVMWGIEGYLEEIKKVKKLVLKKLKQLMLYDYAKFLLANKKHEKIKINQRIIEILSVLIRRGEMPLKKFNALPEVEIYYKATSKTKASKASTKSRDFKKLIQTELAVIHERNGEVFIKPNFEKLERLEYKV